MVAIKNFFTALVATSIVGFTNAIPTPSTGEQVVSSLNTAAAKYDQFHTAIKAFDGQQNQWGAVKSREVAIEGALRQSIAAARSSAPLTDEESQAVMGALAQPYPEFMGDLLTDIIGKKAQFAQIGKQDNVLHILKDLKVLSDDLPDALAKIVDATNADIIDGGKDWSDSLFDDAISAYAQ